MQILKRLGFNVHVVLPYGTLVNYLRLLGLTEREDVSSQAWGYLNDARVSFWLQLSSSRSRSRPLVLLQVADACVCGVCSPHHR